MLFRSRMIERAESRAGCQWSEPIPIAGSSITSSRDAIRSNRRELICDTLKCFLNAEISHPKVNVDIIQVATKTSRPYIRIRDRSRGNKSFDIEGTNNASRRSPPLIGVDRRLWPEQ